MRRIRLLACASSSAALVAALTFTVGRAAAAPGGDPAQATTTLPAADTAPQPLSTADQQDTGANDTSGSNQYLSTRDGSPSQNGSGNGAATGRPCAGCVGKADNKNPPGQYPNGSDANNGYECDANSGIGESNPAHTACTPTVPSTTTTTVAGATTTTTTAAATGPGGGSGPAPTGTPASGPAATLSTQGVETAMRTWLTGSPASGSPRPSTAASTRTGSLAFTGSNLARDALLGLASVVLAGLLYLVDARLRRRRLATPSP
jgi:hypothetical protein